MTYYQGMPIFSLRSLQNPDDVDGLLTFSVSIPQTTNTGFQMDIWHRLNMARLIWWLMAFSEISFEHNPKELQNKPMSYCLKEMCNFWHFSVIFGVREEQARGALHVHILYWNRLLTLLLQTAADIPVLIGSIANSIDQVIQCTVDHKHHVASLLNSQAGIKTSNNSLSCQSRS